MSNPLHVGSAASGNLLMYRICCKSTTWGILAAFCLRVSHSDTKLMTSAYFYINYIYIYIYNSVIYHQISQYLAVCIIPHNKCFKGQTHLVACNKNPPRFKRGLRFFWTCYVLRMKSSFLPRSIVDINSKWSFIIDYFTRVISMFYGFSRLPGSSALSLQVLVQLCEVNMWKRTTLRPHLLSIMRLSQ